MVRFLSGRAGLFHGTGRALSQSRSRAGPRLGPGAIPEPREALPPAMLAHYGVVKRGSVFRREQAAGDGVELGHQGGIAGLGRGDQGGFQAAVAALGARRVAGAQAGA